MLLLIAWGILCRFHDSGAAVPWKTTGRNGACQTPTIMKSCSGGKAIAHHELRGKVVREAGRAEVVAAGVQRDARAQRAQADQALQVVQRARVRGRVARCRHALQAARGRAKTGNQSGLSSR